MKYFLLALLFAGCSEVVTPKVETDARGQTASFLISQEYGFCNDTICIGESVILLSGNYNVLPPKCFVSEIETGDTLYNDLYHAQFRINYDIPIPFTYSVNYGNGITEFFSGSGFKEIKLYCNQNYEIIICYE